MTRRVAAAGIVGTSVVFLLSGPSPFARSTPTERRTDLRGLDGLVRVYDTILSARFDQVDAELRRACGPAPAEACEVLAATALWWRILLDPDSRDLDDEFSTAVERAIQSTEAWTDRAPDSAEAWFYLGGAYAARVQWRVLREERLSAARDGKRIKQALEKAIELDPQLDDAYFGVGMYKYYADVAPAAAKFLRFLLLLPGGDKTEGLSQMLRARTRGRLLQGEADYQLQIIYLWYEREIPKAINILEGLRGHYPENPLFREQIAIVQDTYQHDLTASLESWRALLAAAREQRVNEPAIAEVQSRLAIADLEDRLHQTDHAIEHLNAVIALKPSAPYGSLALAYLRLGEAHDRLGARPDAVNAYRAAINTAATADPQTRTQASERLRRTPDAKRAEAYRLSLEGFRKFEKNDIAGAADALGRSVAMHVSDPVARYRFGRVLQARREDTAALAQFEHAIKNAKSCPAPVLGTTYLEAARLLERAGQRDRAIAYYRVASSLFGAAAETKSAATRALTRLRASQ